jgi:hypothetical protein
LIATNDIAGSFAVGEGWRAMTLDARLENATRCLLALEIAGRVKVVPLPCWSDGDSLWTALRGAGPVVGALRAAQSFAVSAADVLARGSVRIFSPEDPVGLLLHGPVVSMAMSALALRHPGELRHAFALLPVRIALDDPWIPGPLPVGPGIAPALPAVVPADIRRRLSGQRQVLVVTRDAGGVEFFPAAWGAGFALDGAAAPGTELTAVVTDDDAGVALSGELTAAGALHPVHAIWWSGGRSGEAPLPAAPRGAVVLPD